ncbi:hypothetical protein BCV69DRAFT_173660 [Microstroma glucosiphilum]|uniref:NYN domain-containing protein n=1 Tax=Pseudomicrostroma glucosiphilum TaxID=1684307 RepID=A0A316U8J0_9BASI|nr:hypothetical protein BCV69DRAFT_173660 [Pseudomicrostroma glucosiphilum]PWN21557.1 hypothetical protein BCV69DRAFT_173660 [Pseudomicrostroma glucosiphilum]
MASSGSSTLQDVWSYIVSPSPSAAFARSVATAALAGGITFYAFRGPPKIDPPPPSDPPATTATTSSSPSSAPQRQRKALASSDGRESSTESDTEGESKRVRFELMDKAGGLLNRPIPVAVFWDVDNCSPPTGSSGRHLAHSIRKHITSIETGTGPEKEALGPSGPILSFKAYLELSSAEGVSPAQVTLRSELQGSGVSLIDTPKSGRKDVADKMIIADLMAFALDVPPPARIVLISGDRDFAYPLSLIRGRGYQIVLFTPPVGAVPILEASANYVARWRQDVLGMERDGFGRLYASSTPSKPLPRSSSPSRHGRATPAKSSTSSTTAASSNASTTTPSRPTTPTPQPTPSQPAVQAQTAALSGPGAGPVPGVFAPLVQALEEFKKEGQPRPLRSRVALRLTSIDKDVYEKAGASSFRDYAAVAIAAGIVMLGSNGNPGTEWISLRSLDPASFAAPATPGKPSATSAAPSTPVSSSVSQAKAVLVESLQEEDGSEGPDNYAPSPAFEPLLHAILAAESASQRSPPYASAVGQQLDSMIRATPAGQSDPFAMAGTRTFGGYINAAFKSRVAKLVPTEKQGVAALEVMPVYQSYMAKLRRNRTTSPQSTPATAAPASTPAPAYQPARSTPIRPTSPIKCPSSPTFKKGSFFPSLFRSKSDTGSDQSTPNGKKSVWDVPGLILPHQPSGTKIAAVYFPLANALLYQRERGQFYMTDEALHVIVSKHKGMGDRLKDSKVFSRYLDAAQEAGICTLEDGFKAGMRHVRLTPQLCDPKEHDPANASNKRETLPPAGDDPWDDDYEPNHSTPLPKRATASGEAATAAGSKASQEQDTSAASLSSNLPPAGNDPSASVSESAGPVDGSSKAEPKTTSSTTGAATNKPAATGKATLTPTVQDRIRFKPLMDIMLALRKENPPIVAPRRSYVNDLLAKRHGIPVNPLHNPSSSSSTANGAGLSLLTTTTAGKTTTLDLTAFFRDRGATALGDYTRQAEQYGFIHCERETRADGELGKRRLRLTEKYEQLLAQGSSGSGGGGATATATATVRSGSGGGASGSTSGGSTKG